MKHDADTLTLIPTKLSGSVAAPISKSIAQRAVICGALSVNSAQKHVRIFGNVSRTSICDDVSAALSAIKSLGLADYCIGDGVIELSPAVRSCPVEKVLNVGDSAAVLRMLLPLVKLLGGGRFICGESLRRRPLTPYTDIFRDGILPFSDGVSVSGGLDCGIYHVRGDISSQFVSGLLLALPLLDGDSTVRLTTPLVSGAYADMTLCVMREFGVFADRVANDFTIHGRQSYAPRDYRAEGDRSYAAFFELANFFGGNIKICGLSENSLQCDKVFTELFNKPYVDVSQFPDLFPALAAAACRSSSPVTIAGVERLKYKESDRLSAMTEELSTLGVSITQGIDSITIFPSDKLLNGGNVHSHGDHRIVMALSMLACVCSEPLVMHGCECVKKSAPRFFDDYRSIGGITL